MKDKWRFGTACCLIRTHVEGSVRLEYKGESDVGLWVFVLTSGVLWQSGWQLSSRRNFHTNEGVCKLEAVDCMWRGICLICPHTDLFLPCLFALSQVSWFTYLPTYLFPTYLLTYWLTYLLLFLTYLFNYSYLLNYLPTYLLIYLLSYLPIYLLT